MDGRSGRKKVKWSAHRCRRRLHGEKNAREVSESGQQARRHGAHSPLLDCRSARRGRGGESGETARRVRTYGVVKVVPQGNGCADDTAEVEDGPEYGDEHALLVLGGICEHERSLCGPEKAGTDAQVGAGGEDKGTLICVDVVRPARGLAAVRFARERRLTSRTRCRGRIRWCRGGG